MGRPRGCIDTCLRTSPQCFYRRACLSLRCCCCQMVETERDRLGEWKRSVFNEAPLCMIRAGSRVPGVWHGLAPVITKLLLRLRNIHLPPHHQHRCQIPFPSLHNLESDGERGGEGVREREVETWGQTEKRERVQTEAMWECVIWNRFSANDPG